MSIRVVPWKIYLSGFSPMIVKNIQLWEKTHAIEIKNYD